MTDIFLARRGDKQLLIVIKESFEDFDDPCITLIGLESKHLHPVDARDFRIFGAGKAADFGYSADYEEAWGELSGLLIDLSPEERETFDGLTKAYTNLIGELVHGQH